MSTNKRGPSVSSFDEQYIADNTVNSYYVAEHQSHKRLEKQQPRRDLSAPAPDQSRKQEMEAMQRRLSQTRKPEKNPSATRADVLD